MRVKLIQVTQNPIDVMWTAARTCYSEKSPVEIWEDWQKVLDPNNEEVVCDFNEYTNKKEKHWNLVKKVLDSGHQSIAEHVYFTFAIEGISRACSHQLVRHRAGIVFSQQSQRYVEIKESLQELKSLELETNGEYAKEELIKILDKYFIGVNDNNYLSFLECLECYLEDTTSGEKAEDARAILPNATKTNITMSVNFRELIHLCNLRLCTRAQLEIRNLFKLIVKEVKNVDERLASYLVPQCEVLGLCTEHQCCGRKPKLSDIMKGYEEYNYYKNNITPCEFDTLSEDDYNMLMEAIKNPKVNQKLVEFMKQPNILDN